MTEFLKPSTRNFAHFDALWREVPGTLTALTLSGWHATTVALIGFGGADCEALRDGLLAQPVNSLSSLAYVAAAIVLVRRQPRHRVPALALAAVGVGSFLYHGPMPDGAEPRA